jgi:predicted dehydrogenase
MRKIATNVLGKQGPLVTDNLEALSDLDLDAIYVVTPIPSHYHIVKEVYARNISSNLFVEKTLTSTYTQSEELYNLSRNRKGITMVGYMKRFSVTFRRAKDLLTQKVIGDLISFDASAYSSDFVGVKNDNSVSSARGGVLEDLGSHVVDLALWFFGELHITSAKTSAVVAPNSTDCVTCDVKGPDGLEGSIDVSWVKLGYRMPEFGLTIRGAKGVLMVDDSELNLAVNKAEPVKWYRQDLDDNVVFLLGEPEFYRETEHFIKSCINSETPEPNFQTAMKVDSLIEEVRGRAT